MALKQVKNKIVATGKTAKVTKAMEAVSAVKMRKSQARALSGKAYAEAAIRVLYRMSKSQNAESFFGVQQNTDAPECLIVITSDKGLCGNLNSSVLKECTLHLKGRDTENTKVITFGRKAYEHFSRLGFDIVENHTNISDDVSLNDMHDVVALITEKFNTGEFSKVSIAYQSFVSIFEQNAVLRQVLPLDPLVLEMMVRDIVPKKGAFSDLEKNLQNHVYTIEPSPEEVLHVLAPQLLQIMLYHSLLENKASEHSARMVAMKNATDKAKEMTKALTLIFNKERQAMITAEVSEITGGIEAMKH